MDIQKSQFPPEQYFISNPFWARAILLDGQDFSEYLNLVNSLPENVKDVVYSAEAADVIALIGQKNNLKDRQTNLLAIETGKILSGEAPLNKFIPSLSKILNSDTETARMAAQEINIKIFSKAALQIKKLQEKNFPELAATAKQPEQQQQNRQPSPVQPVRNIIPEYHPTTKKQEERVVNLRKEAPVEQPKKPVMIDPGPKIEGNIIDLSS